MLSVLFRVVSCWAVLCRDAWILCVRAASLVMFNSQAASSKLSRTVGG